MSNYRLNVLFKEADLPLIYASNEKVVIVKHTVGGATSQVAWVTFSPFQSNTVAWETNFALYASTTEVEHGATVHKLSDKIASTKTMYSFKDGIFQQPKASDTLSANTYALTNEQDETSALTFGLAQGVTVNGTAFANNPINAVLVPKGHKVEMTPIEKLDIFLQSDINDSTVVSHVSSIALPIMYNEEMEHTVEYNGATGQFFIK